MLIVDLLLFLLIIICIYLVLAFIAYVLTTSVLISIIIPLIVYVAYYWIRRYLFIYNIKKLETSLGPEAPVVTIDGKIFRDLNKNGKLDPYEDVTAPLEDRVEDLLQQMSIEEKIGQMFSPMMNGGDKKGRIKTTKGMFDKYTVHQVVIEKNISTMATMGTIESKAFAIWHNTIQKLAERTRLGIPITLCSDPRHDFIDSSNLLASLLDASLSKWPQPPGLGAIGDPKVVFEFGKIAREELRALGIRFALHPMADLATEPRWGRISGTFGSSAELTGPLVSAYIKGFQGDIIDNTSVACCVKHFPGGGPQKDGLDPHSYHGREQVYPGKNFEYHKKPFMEAFKAGVVAVMPYYGLPKGIGLEEVGFNFNKEVTTTMLREEMSFTGIVHTDYNIINSGKLFNVLKVQSMSWGVQHLSPVERVEKAVNAGIDQLGGDGCTELLLELYNQKKISEERINESVRRVLRLKFQLGLFDNPYVDPDKAEQICGKETFTLAGEEAMRKSLVLLKNGKDSPVLPLTGRPKFYVEGFDKVIVAKYGTVVKKAEEADYALLKLTSPKRPSYKDVASMFFPQGALDFKPKDLKKIRKIMAIVPTIISIYLERPAVIPELKEEAEVLVGNFGVKQSILLDLLFGKFKPTGKLPFELPASMETVLKQKSDVPDDSGNPCFPVGFGLTL